MNMIVKILTVAALVSCCVVSMIDAFKPISNHRLELIGTNKLMSVTHRNALTCCIGVSMTALRAGLKKEDEEEYFESDVGITRWQADLLLGISLRRLFSNQLHIYD